eukprot:3204630-Amphidinium_carterae.2
MTSELSSHVGGLDVEIGSPIRVWLICHNAWLLARFQTYKGTTPFSRLFGLECTNGLCYLGRAEEGSDEHILAAESGMIQKFRTVRKVEPARVPSMEKYSRMGNSGPKLASC